MVRPTWGKLAGWAERLVPYVISGVALIYATGQQAGASKSANESTFRELSRRVDEINDAGTKQYRETFPVLMRELVEFRSEARTRAQADSEWRGEFGQRIRDIEAAIRNRTVSAERATWTRP